MSDLGERRADNGRGRSAGAADPTPLIVVEGLGKSFRGRPALGGVTFSVPEGEVFGLVGPNGSGKTTLLRILVTLLPADEGRATIGGFAVDESPEEVRALIGYVPDHSGTYPRLDATQFLELFAGVYRLPRSQRRRMALELLEVVGLADRAGDDIATFSRGQQQRLGLARALLHDPSVLLIDDISSLDPRAQAELEHLVDELHQAGKTIIVTSHQLAELEGMCTWVGLLVDGSMLATGPLAEVRSGRTLRQAFLDLIPAERPASP